MPSQKAKESTSTASSSGSHTLKEFFGKSASPLKSSQSFAGSASKGNNTSSIPSLSTAKNLPETSSKAGKSSNGRSVSSTKRKSDAVIGGDELDSPPRKKLAASVPRNGVPDAKKTATVSQKSRIASSDIEDDDAPPQAVKPSSKSRTAHSNEKVSTLKTSKTPKSRKSLVVSSDSDDIPPPKLKPALKPAPHPSKSELSTKDKASGVKKPVNGTAKGKEVDKDRNRAEVGEASGPPKAKYDYAAKARRMAAGPVAHGSKPIPDGASNALAGLSFVFTGELSAFSREEAQELVKRFGGRITLQPSSKTSYVVLGSDAGPSKLAAIKKHGLHTLDEDGLLNLIRTREGAMDEKTQKKMKEEEEKVRKAAVEIENREKAAVKQGLVSDITGQLWTTKYAPQNLREVCGNKGQVEKLQRWLHDWPTSLKSGFKKPGKDGMNIYRAMLISGPPGIGKTTSAHLCARLEGFTAIELNASDARSKKLIENAANINNTSLDGFLAGDKKTNVTGVEITNRTVLILDEVDGMSAGDRGGIGAINALIKKSKVPIICIANDRTLQKMKPLQGTTYGLPFRRPEANMVRSRIKTIAFREKIDLPGNVIDQLVAGTQSDIRQVLNILSTWKLSHNSMDFDQGKAVIKDNEKYSVMTPFNVSHKILGPYLFSQTARESLNDKLELYFHDMSLVPLLIQENYLRTQPAKLKHLSGPELTMKHLEYMDKAASSISDGDLVDALIHSPEQLWTLLPLHAALSTIRPASYLYGMGGGYGGPNAASFPAWLGQNSKQGKLQRQLGDIQVRMRLVTTGDKGQIRQSYLPALYSKLIKPLADEGVSAVPDVMDVLDQYYLTKDDWDAVVELGIGDNNEETVLKSISSATKASFTRKYNSTEHPIAFHKASDLGKPAKKLGGGPVPDHEDVLDIEEDEEEEKEEKEVDPIAKDKLIKEAKVKGKGKADDSTAKSKKSKK